MRKMYGHTRKDDDWRMTYNTKLDEFIGVQDLFQIFVSRRIKWLGHVDMCRRPYAQNST